MEVDEGKRIRSGWNEQAQNESRHGETECRVGGAEAQNPTNAKRGAYDIRDEKKIRSEKTEGVKKPPVVT